MQRTVLCLLIFLTTGLVNPVVPTRAQDTNLLEKFVFATDRDSVLKKLVPGTEQYYYLHSLHYQNGQQLEKVDKMLAAWEKRRGKTNQWKLINNRQMLLRYSSDPKKTLEFLRKELRLNFNHQRAIPAADRRLPSKLDPKLIDIDAILQRHLQRSGIEQITPQGMHLLVGQNLKKTQRRQLLDRVTRPDFPGLTDWILAELKEKDSKSFGKLSIHRQLTLKQLDELSEKRPSLKTESRFVNIYLSKLRPSEDVNWVANRDERRKYLSRLRQFTSTLPASFNSLKANVLYQLLQLNLSEEKYDRELFLDYLKLPRETNYCNREFIKSIRSRSHIARLNSDYSAYTRLPPVGRDESLVQKYLHHYLSDAEDYVEFSPYIEDGFLKRQFAIAKITSGNGEVEKWASMLSPGEYKSLLDRVDIDFAASNPEFFSARDDIELDMFLKNVDKLIVKVFEINTSNFYQKFKREIDTDINLDGLTANYEKTYSYDSPPAIRSRKTFKFPELAGRGVYVIDFIAGGKSSRALVRKGRLQLLNQMTAAGHALTVLSSDLGQIADASVWIDGRRYERLENGQILVPFSTQPGMRAAVITSGEFSCLQMINQSAETYSLTAAMLLDRENLLRSNDAKVIIRPSLTVAGGAQVPVELLKDTRLRVTVVNLDGVSTTKTIGDVQLHDDQETVCEFVVPPRCKSISLSLTSKIKNISAGREDSFSVNQSYTINQIDASDTIQDIHLVPTNNGYFIEALGKTGETRAGQAVRVQLQIDAFHNEVNVDLQTDKNGRISLGRLPGIRSIKVNPAVGKSKSWVLPRQDQTNANTIQAAASTLIELPAPAGINKATRRSVSLLELRGGSYVADYFSRVQIAKGLVKIKSLPAGDYRLRLTSPITPLSGNSVHDTLIRVTDGKVTSGVLVSSTRHLQDRSAPGVQIATIAGNKKTVRVELENATDSTRVHVLAARYQPAFDAFGTLAKVRSVEPWNRVPSVRRSTYQTGRKIGDEYEYILRRKHQEKFPGNMLTRPSLLLNPWAVRETSNQSQDAQKGDPFGAAGNDQDSKSSRGKANQKAVSGTTDFANLDFLGDGSVLLLNLKPNKQGVLEIDRKDLGSNQHIRIVAASGFETVERHINFPLKQLTPRDSRLADILPPDQHFSQSKQTRVMSQGDTLDVDDLVSAKFQTYDDLADVYTLLQTLNRSPHLNKFAFILTWADKNQDEKTKLYSQYACHELNFWLSRKDQPFFESVVAPHLQNKRTKTFIDHYLLEGDLSPYATPWQFARLNTVERILLADRLKGRRRELLRSIDEGYQVAPVSRSEEDRLYDITIRGLGLAENRDLSRQKERILGSIVNLPKLAANSSSQFGEKMSFAAPGMAGGMGGDYGGMGMAPNRLDDDAEEFGMEPEAAGESRIANGQVQSQLRRSGRKADASSKPQFAAMIAGNESRFDDLERLTKKRGQRYRTETRSRTVPITRMRTEQKTRQVVIDGKKITQNYTVQVPYTENVTQSYSVQVPISGKDNIDGDKNTNGLPVYTGEKLAELRKQTKRLYRRVAATQEWIENNYYLLPSDQQNPGLVPINRFWRDYAARDAGPFLSPNFADAHHSFTETMFALAVLDLPLKAKPGETEFVDNSMTYTAAGPTIAVHQQVEAVNLELGNTKILVSENFYQKNDRYRFEDGMRFDKFVSDEFRPHTLYGSQVVVTNPTSTPRSVEILTQIPEGSISCSGSQQTRTILFELAAFSTKTFDYSFYFPTAGDFKHYPAHVSAKGKALAVADGIEFNVVDEQPEVDQKSWNYISQNGSEDQVIDFLNRENIRRLDLNKIAFRMKDKKFFGQAIETLRNRFTYNPTLWAYGIMHDDVPSIREYMSHVNKVTKNLGWKMESELVTLDPVLRTWYQHKEYWPLINARAHQLGAQRRILNPQFKQQYQQLLQTLSYSAELNDDANLALTYYLLLQDRVGEAVKRFGKVNSANISYKIQHDYCDAYLDFYLEQPESAAEKAAKWADYPVDHWRKRFVEILNQVEEIKAGETKLADADNAAQQQTKLAAESESIDLEIVGSQAKLSYQNVDSAVANFYEMDIEQLFSRSPFAQDDLDGFSLIRPNMSTKLKLKVDATGQGSKKLSLPKELRNKNVLVEIVAGEQTRSQPLFANSLTLAMFENYGQLQVRVEKTSRPLPKAYVKVYARMTNGTVRFHKDGYTDLRGRFDYVSQSNRSNDGIAKFSILIMSDENGAMIRQANPPRE